MALERTAILVIRAWFEEGLEDAQLRARIIDSTDAMSTDRYQRTVAGEREIIAAVVDWLRAFAERS